MAQSSRTRSLPPHRYLRAAYSFEPSIIPRTSNKAKFGILPCPSAPDRVAEATRIAEQRLVAADAQVVRASGAVGRDSCEVPAGLGFLTALSSLRIGQ